MRSLPFVAALMLVSAGAVAAPKKTTAQRTIMGQITDSTCLAKGEKPHAEHAECAVRCIQGGAPIAIVEDKTGQVFVALAGEGKSLHELLLPHVGRRSKITGKAVRLGGAQFFVVDEVAGEHEHSSHQGGMVAMAGDAHLEVMLLESGEVRVYLTDAFRKPVPLAEKKGMVEARARSEVRSAPLVPESGGAYLRAQLDPLKAPLVEVTVRLPLPADPKYFITFMLEPAKSAEAHQGHPMAAASGAQDVHINVAGNYEPSQITLKKGVPVRLHFMRKESGTCASELLIPAFGVKQKLAPLAETVVELTPDKAGTFEFTCGMDMMRGKLTVVE